MDLKKLYEDRYKIMFDEAFKYNNVCKEDLPWYYEIPAKHGFFYPYDENRIALWCASNRIKGMLRKRFKLELIVDGDDECILLLLPDQFEAVAEMVVARRKRRLSPEHKAKLLEGAKPHWFRKGEKVKNQTIL